MGANPEALGQLRSPLHGYQKQVVPARPILGCWVATRRGNPVLERSVSAPDSNFLDIQQVGVWTHLFEPHNNARRSAAVCSRGQHRDVAVGTVQWRRAGVGRGYIFESAQDVDQRGWVAKGKVDDIRAVI